MDILEEIINDEQDTFRDTIATVDEKGKRIWVYPRKPKGYFHNRRLLVSYILLIVFFGTPFIWIGGHPWMLFNLFERKFIFFGTVFMPQDFHLVAIGAITFFVFVILFTVLYGRLWCGWACPQTVFMEMVFRKIEYFIEGDANQQRKLNAQTWNAEKIWKKSLKQFVFALISVLIAHTAMAYLIGIDQVFQVITKPPTQNLTGFTGLVAFTFIFYGVFAYFREQACIAVCPYGRLQSVLLGKDSMVVAYDHKRGEPRGKLKRKDPQQTNKALTIDDLIKPQGDCIDCKLCVQVCPTGIDIRHGTQMECVNCTACIDVCDEVMDKVKKPKGLIRFASLNQIETGAKFKFTPRMIAYSLVLVLLLGVLGILLVERGDTETTVIRMRGTTYTELPNGDFSNVYELKVANKTFEDLPLTLKLKSKKGKIIIAGGDLTAKKNNVTQATMVIALPPSEIKKMKTDIAIEVYSKNKLLETVEFNFLGTVK
jgi:cytochrome c oxidase accessory protein FixG